MIPKWEHWGCESCQYPNGVTKAKKTLTNRSKEGHEERILMLVCLITKLSQKTLQNHKLAKSPSQLYTKIFLQRHLPSNCVSKLGVASPLLLIFVVKENYFKTHVKSSSYFPWNIFVFLSLLELHIAYNGTQIPILILYSQIHILFFQRASLFVVRLARVSSQEALGRDYPLCGGVNS